MCLKRRIVLLLATLFGMYPFLKKLFADGGYQEPEFHPALTKLLPQLETEIIKRSDHAKGFVVLPRRWVVERTIAWLNRCRRLAKDWENLNRKRWHSCASHQSASCSENFVIPLDVPGQTLRGSSSEDGCVAHLSQGTQKHNAAVAIQNCHETVL
jgi:hypothetical protein